MRFEAWLGACCVLCAILAPFACGSDDASSAQNGSDAASGDAPTSSDAISTTSDGGCTASQESDNDGGCVSVVAAGTRKLAMEVNPPAALSYTTEVDVAKGIGVSTVPIELSWSTIEASEPDAGTSEIDTSLFSDLVDVYSTRPISLLIGLPLVDTVSVLAPPDLAPGLTAGTLAFDDASVIARYEKLLDAMFTALGTSVKVPYLLVANEENVYLSSKADTQWTALANFYAAIKAYLAIKQPSTIVGMNVSFGGLLDATQTTKLTTLFASSPDVFVSYYLGNNGFGSASSTTLPADFDTMIAFAGARPVIVKELGYATGTSGHDNAGQVAFITDLFQSWDAHASQIPLVTISRMYDGSISDCTAQAQSYGDPGDQQFIEFLCTLGVRDINDVPKPAWARLVDAASRRGF